MLAFVIATGLGLIGVADDAPKSVQERYQTLSKEYDTRLNAFYKEYFAAKTDVAKKEISRRSRPNQADYAHRFYLLAVEEPQGPAASDALYEVLQLQPDQLTPEGAEAFARLRRDFATSPKMGNYIQQLSMRPWPCVEPLLREVLDHSPDRTARGQACLGLAGKLASRAAISKYMNDPEMAHRYRENYGEDYIQAILKEDPEANLRESTALYERVLAEFADVRFFPAFPHDKSTLRKHAETWLAAQSELAIGKPAPEIEGTDVDGKPFKLSDYRGKVVVLVFWASWCGPCMQQIPSERELLKKMAGRPFVLLGVNCVYKLAAAKKALLEEQVIWPNWYDGDPRDGKIASRYHIQGIPAVFVLDAEGIIREKEVRGVPLEAAVEDLLKKQSTSKGAAPIR